MNTVLIATIVVGASAVFLIALELYLKHAFSSEITDAVQDELDRLEDKLLEKQVITLSDVIALKEEI
jgi:hypothetical protein